MKLAMLGTGMIVKDALYALTAVDEIEVQAIFARPKSREKAEALAEQYHIPEIYTDYDELLAKTEAEFVYVGLVNSAHHDYTKKALLAGKHVILEKPFTSTVAEAKDLVETARETGMYLFEAVTSLHSKVFHKMQEILPSLGNVRIVNCNFSQYSSRYDNYKKGIVAPAFDPECSGGTLYDINIYNLNVIIGLMGEPLETIYYPNLGFNKIDTSGTAILRYPEFTAIATAAKDSDSPCFCIVQGDEGWMQIPGKPNEVKSLEYCINGTVEKYEPEEDISRMVNEFHEFADIYARQDYAAMNHYLDVSLQVLSAAESARKKAGIEFAVDREA